MKYARRTRPARRAPELQLTSLRHVQLESEPPRFSEGPFATLVIEAQVEFQIVAVTALHIQCVVRNEQLQVVIYSRIVSRSKVARGRDVSGYRSIGAILCFRTGFEW